ncbi:MAG: formate--phosphoribosylaminoimidazolecarboxamide ligase [Candidatus Hydrothermarchaeales archaeon]
MISRDEMLELFKDYREVTVATLGSHSALQILKGAKDEGFKTLAICKTGRSSIYKRFRVADDIITVGDYRDMLQEDVLEKLRDKGCVLVPHGSLVAYLGTESVEKELSVPLLGNRGILRWEADRKLERQWLEKAGVEMPNENKDPKDISVLSIVKFPGARGGRGYFLVNNYSDFEHKSREMLRKKRISREDLENVTIQDYIAGVNMYISYFYSPLQEEVELFGMDRRYEANIDGLTRIPAAEQSDYVEPSYVVVGNTPLVARESLLEKVLEMGDNLTKVSKEIAPPGMIGPFCLETMVTRNLKFIAFEISARIVAGTNPYMDGSPYSYILHGANMSMGRRIAVELKNALKDGKEELLIT